MNVYEIYTTVFAVFGLFVGGVVLLVVGLPLVFNYWRAKERIGHDNNDNDRNDQYAGRNG